MEEIILPTSESDPYGIIAKCKEYEIVADTPHYLPRGFILINVEYNNADEYKCILFRYDNGSQFITISIDSYIVLQMLYGVFTKEYADELAKYYIDENGEFLQFDGARGSNIFYFDHCFIPVSSDENTVEFKAVVTYCHSDNPYDISFDDDFHYVMKNTEDGWRVDRFDVWS